MNDLRKRIIEEIPDEDETMSTSTLADAVLAVVTAHMAVNESDIVATNHVFGCERRENALRVALEAFVVRKLKAETR